ncbi:MAG: hypothetical protein IT200_07025 [Thermoleophilia bacterium]|nr:hypothetical protein [Thermoleophilia bacterium]
MPPPPGVPIPEELIDDVRVVAHAAVMELVDLMVRRARDGTGPGSLFRELAAAHGVFLRATHDDDYDPAFWESYLHHPELPTVGDTLEVIRAFEARAVLWGAGADLTVAVERVRGALS